MKNINDSFRNIKLDVMLSVQSEDEEERRRIKDRDIFEH